MSTKSFIYTQHEVNLECKPLGLRSKLAIYLILLCFVVIISTANAAPLPQVGQLTMSKSGPSSVGSQGNITYQLTVSNTGSLTVTGVVITDTVPLSTTLLSTTQNGTELNGVVTWNKLPDLAAGQAMTVEMTVKAPFWQAQREHDGQTQRERARLEPRIIGGLEAEAGAWPWQAAIVDANNPNAYNGQKCGGTLIAPEWVMTAAHCVQNVAFGARDVLLGQHLLSGSGGQRINGVWWYIHPNFDSILLDSDIALIRLAHPAELNDQVQWIDLVTPADFALDAAGVMATVTGWGNVNSSGGASYPDGLRQVEVPIVTNQACETGYDQTEFPSDWITDNMMCAGYFEGGKDACNGDSGGPLVVPVPSDSGKWKQAGIVSWGQGCAVVGEPGVYTRVSKFSAWVQQIITTDASPLNTVFNHRYGAKADNGLAVQGTRMVVTKITASITQPKLAISKSGPTAVQAGGVMTYQLNITNSGSAAATNLVITDVLPTGVTFLRANNSGVLQNGLVQWQFSRLEVSGTKTVQFTVQESSGLARQKRNLTPHRPRIFGGEVSQAGAWPWQAYLKVGGSQCGGVLIDKGWVLTAAHCVYNNNKVTSPLDAQVVLGAQNINQVESSQQHLTVTAVIPHELYLTNEQDDIALLQLATPATLNDRVQPIALFTGGTLADPGVLAMVTGWGVTELGGTSSLLKQVTVAIVSNKACNLVYQVDNIKITDGMICAGGQAGQDSCNGDSGGPLVVPNGSGGYLLAGLVSFGGLKSGKPCGDAGVPGVYARVSYYVNWIKANMGEVAPVPSNLIVNINYGVRADGGWAVKGTQRVTTTIYNGIVVPTSGGTITLSNYLTFTSNAQTFNGQLVGLSFTNSLTNIAPMSTSQLKAIGLAYDLAAVDIASQKAISPTGRYSIALNYASLLPLACNLKESSLALYYYANGVWQLESTSQVNQTTKMVSATPNHFSTWAILANITKCRTYLPLINKKYCPDAFSYNETVLYDMRAINANQVWAVENCFQPGKGIIVAVLDTGVDLTHPDLEANLVMGRNFIEGSGFDPEDDHGHGTNVAGIIAAVGNNGNAIGVAPTAQIMPVRVLGEGGGTFAGVAQGIAWATDHGANIINMSLGGTATSNAMRDAVDYAHNKGVFLVAAAGNCGDQYYASNGCSFRDQTNYPAAYDSVMAVASTNEVNEQSTFSNQNNYVEIAAPGSNIYNAYLYGSYRSISGTSQATPHVAGLAALIWSRNRNLTNEEVRALIRNTATDLGARGRDIQYGYGLINAAKALNLTTSARTIATSENPPEPAPTEAINAPFVAGQLLVKLKPGAKLSDVLQQQALQSQGVAETIPQITVQLINVPVGQERAYLEQLQQSTEVEYVELNGELGIRN